MVLAIAPKVKLNNGLEMPVLGLGTYMAKDDVVRQAVGQAIDAGYRHVDTALYYGNEAEVGEAIKEKIRDGVVQREDIFVVTKVDIGTIPIPKSSNKQRIEENIRIFDFKLNSDDIVLIDSLNTGTRLYNYPLMQGHKYYPFDAEY